MSVSPPISHASPRRRSRSRCRRRWSNPAAFSAMFTVLSLAITPRFSTSVPMDLHRDGVARGRLVVVAAARGGRGDLAVARTHQGERARGRVHRAHPGGRRGVAQGRQHARGRGDRSGTAADPKVTEDALYCEPGQRLVALGDGGEADRGCGRGCRRCRPPSPWWSAVFASAVSGVPLITPLPVSEDPTPTAGPRHCTRLMSTAATGVHGADRPAHPQRRRARCSPAPSARSGPPSAYAVTATGAV